MYRSCVRKNLVFSKLSMWVLVAANLFQATFLRPSGDDYAALGRSAASCGTWLNFAQNKWENSQGFLIFARVTFCWDYSKFEYTYNLMVATHVLLSLAILSLIVLKITNQEISRSLVISVASVINLFLFFPVSKSLQPIRQYLGPGWSSEWLQHTFAFELVVLSAILILKFGPSGINSKNRLLTISTLSFCMVYSNLNFAYSVPLVASLLWKLFKIRSRISRLEIFISMLMITISLGIAISNFQNLNRVGIAEDAQVDESKFLRIFPLLYFSLRESLLVPLVYAIILFIIGRLVTKSRYRNSNIFFLLFFFFWVQIILTVAEISTYYATWHHTPLQVLLYVISFELGRKVGPIRKGFKIKSVTSAAAIFIGQFLSGTQLAAYANHWDLAREINFQNENYLQLPRNLGIRTDSYWINFLSKEQRMILISKVSEHDVQKLEPLYQAFNLHIVVTDSILSALLDNFDGAERVTSWQI